MRAYNNFLMGRSGPKAVFMGILLAAFAVLLGILLFSGYMHTPINVGVVNPPPPTLTLGYRTKTSGCLGGTLPDSQCTPGAIFTTATRQAVCTPGYSKGVRNVPASEKAAVYKEYSILSHTAGQYEVDHLVSLELGGSNSIANLWPEAAIPLPGFHQKDMVENYLHYQVCAGLIPLSTAQREIATNWVDVLNGMAHPYSMQDIPGARITKSPPLPPVTVTPATVQGSGASTAVSKQPAITSIQQRVQTLPGNAGVASPTRNLPVHKHSRGNSARACIPKNPHRHYPSWC